MSNFMYAVICSRHGTVELSEAQYNRQMMQADSLWKCPKCGGSAEWDDDCLCTNPPDEDDVSVPIEELVRLQECELRCAWLMPIVTGEDSEHTNAKTLALAQALALGMDGNDAVDTARRVAP